MVSRVLGGDTNAFGLIVEKYQGAVYATAYYYVGRHGVAEDMAQETFWAAYRGLDQLRDPSRLGPWLKEIACRTSANWVRGNAARVHHETPMPHSRMVSLEDARKGPLGRLEREETLARVHTAINTLPERYRLPVVLRYLQELSYREIGEFTGESLDEVRGVLQRAGRQLRALLGDLDTTAEGSGEWRPARK